MVEANKNVDVALASLTDIEKEMNIQKSMKEKSISTIETGKR